MKLKQTYPFSYSHHPSNLVKVKNVHPEAETQNPEDQSDYTTSIFENTSMSGCKKIIPIRNPLENKKIFIKRRQSKELNKKWEYYLKHSSKLMQMENALKLIEESNFVPKSIFHWLVTNAKQKVSPKLFKLRRNQMYMALSEKIKYPLEKTLFSTLSLLPHKIINRELIEIVGSFLVHREDISLSPTLLYIAQTFYSYTPNTPILYLFSYFSTFSLIYMASFSEVYFPLLTNSHSQKRNRLSIICRKIQKNPTFGNFTHKQKIELEPYVEYWIKCFWLPIDGNGGLLRQKILLYMLLNKFSLQSLIRVCESVIVGLNHVWNKGVREKTESALMNPKMFVDEELMVKYLYIN